MVQALQKESCWGIQTWDSAVAHKDVQEIIKIWMWLVGILMQARTTRAEPEIQKGDARHPHGLGWCIFGLYSYHASRPKSMCVYGNLSTNLGFSSYIRRWSLLKPWRRPQVFITKFDQNHRITYFEHAESDYQAGFSIKLIVFLWETLKEDVNFVLFP